MPKPKKKAMPTKTRRFIMSILILAAATVWWSWMEKNQRGGMPTMLGQACTLQVACLAYSHRHEETFPDALEELVGSKVLGQEEYDGLTRDVKWRYFGRSRKSTEPDFVLAMTSEPIWNATTKSSLYLKIHSQVGVTMEEDASIEETQVVK